MSDNFQENREISRTSDFIKRNGSVVKRKDNNDKVRGHEKRRTYFLEDPPTSSASDTNLREVEKLIDQHHKQDIAETLSPESNPAPLEVPDLRYSEPGWEQWNETQTPENPTNSTAPQPRRPAIRNFEDHLTTTRKNS